MKKPQSGCRNKIDKPFTRSKAEWFLFYCLRSKYTMTMTKAKFMIDIPTNAKNSSLIVINNIASTIAPPPLSISQQIAVEQVCIHQRVKVATNSAYSHFLCFTLYNIFK